MVGVAITHYIFHIYSLVIPVLALIIDNGSFKNTRIVNKNMRKHGMHQIKL